MNYLNVYLNNLYYEIGQVDYETLVRYVAISWTRLDQCSWYQWDYYARSHAEEITTRHPALYLNGQPARFCNRTISNKISPNLLPVAENDFKVKIRMANIAYQRFSTMQSTFSVSHKRGLFIVIK